MVALYAKMIEDGRYTLNKVPKKFGWYDGTKAKLIEDGYTINEDGTVTKNEDVE